jgi:hypothetical protein
VSEADEKTWLYDAPHRRAAISDSGSTWQPPPLAVDVRLVEYAVKAQAKPPGFRIDSRVRRAGRAHPQRYGEAGRNLGRRRGTQASTVGRRDGAEPGGLVMSTRMVVEEMTEHDVGSILMNFSFPRPRTWACHIAVTLDSQCGSTRQQLPTALSGGQL